MARYTVPTCKPIQTKPFRVCTGDLKHLIKIYTRSITPAQSIGIDFGEDFTNEKNVYAMIETGSGETVFDQTNTEKVVTHKFYIRFIPDLTFEAWIEFKGKYYDILNVENLNEEDRYMLLNACIRGTVLKPVNFA